MKKLGIVAAFALGLFGAGLLVIGPAFGHADFISSSIADGEVFDIGGGNVPGTITLVFDEELDSSRSTMYVVQLGEDIIVDRGNLSVEKSQMTIDMNVLDEGIYQVHWSTVDTEEAGFRTGTITFAVHF